ncbi:hypothetical protein FKM82_006804 [Ascaphus truei]
MGCITVYANEHVFLYQRYEKLYCTCVELWFKACMHWYMLTCSLAVTCLTHRRAQPSYSTVRPVPMTTLTDFFLHGISIADLC